GSRSLHASPVTAGYEARETAQGDRASAPTPGQGKAGRVNASESLMRFRYPSRSQLTSPTVRVTSPHPARSHASGGRRIRRADTMDPGAEETPSPAVSHP